MQPKKALILGASGLVGSQLLHLLLHSPQIEQVRALVRHPLHWKHPKLEEVVVDFNNPDAFRQNFGHGDIIFSCIGTTMKNVKGNKELYRQIDYNIPVHAAGFGIEAGYPHFVLVSAHLANAHSSIFYNRLKGETEEKIQTFPFESIQIFRPSFLVGKRKETRILELTGGKLIQLLSPLLPAAYRPIEADVLAKAMLHAVYKNQTGTHLYTYTDIKSLAGSFMNS